MRIIGISGKAEAGKDTMAGFIKAVYTNTRRVAFADDLKLQAIRLWSVDHPEYPYAPFIHSLTDKHLITQADNLKVSVPDFRTFLQDYGVQKREEEGADYWVERCFQRHLNLYGPSRDLVIPDVRFKNEAEAIRKRRGLLVRVTRPNHTNRLNEEQRAHISETDLDDYEHFHAFVENHDDPAKYLAEVLLVVRPYLQRW